jgi:hypothetical protein
VASGRTNFNGFCDSGWAMNKLKVGPGQTLLTVWSGGPVSGPDFDEELAQAAPQVSRVQLRLSDGSVHNIRPVAADSGKYFVYLLKGVKITQWTTFDTAGHELGTGTYASL